MNRRRPSLIDGNATHSSTVTSSSGVDYLASPFILLNAVLNKEKASFVLKSAGIEGVHAAPV